MRIMKKLAYNAIKLATLACVGGFIAGTGTMIFAGGKITDLENIKNDICEEYIESNEFEQEYLNTQENLNNQYKHGLITRSEMLKEMSKISSEEKIEKALIKSDSLLGEIYRRAVDDYEKERNSLLVKTVAGLSCAIPAYVGGAVLDKIDKKKLEKKVDEDIAKNNAEYTK